MNKIDCGVLAAIDIAKYEDPKFDWQPHTDKINKVFDNVRMDFLDVLASILTCGIYYFCYYKPMMIEKISAEVPPPSPRFSIESFDLNHKKSIIPTEPPSPSSSSQQEHPEYGTLFDVAL